MSMTSRQRVLSAINHVQPDRVPIDFGGHRSSGIMAIAYRKLREHLGLHIQTAGTDSAYGISLVYRAIIPVLTSK
jgi:hypothetical protein